MRIKSLVFSLKDQNKILAELATLLALITVKITDDSDMLWGWYETPAALRLDLLSYIDQLRKGDISCLRELELLFAPTSVLQEHSIQNDWSSDYLILSSKFDLLLESLT